MGMDFGGGPRPPMGGGMPGAGPGGPAAGAGPVGSDIRAELAALRDSLPPEIQHKLDPSNAITALLYKRLRELDEAEGRALLTMVDAAEPESLQAFKAFLPELELLIDMFDDGEVNGSIGDGQGVESVAGFGGGFGGGAPVGGPAPIRPLPDDEEEELEPVSRLGSIMG